MYHVSCLQFTLKCSKKNKPIYVLNRNWNIAAMKRATSQHITMTCLPLMLGYIRIDY